MLGLAIREGAHLVGEVPPARRRGRQHVALALALIAAFLVPFSLFLTSANHELLDSNYSMMLSEHLLRSGNFQLDNYFQPPLDPHVYPGMRPTGLPYLVQAQRGHLYYVPSPVGSVLAMPFVFVWNQLGVHTIDAQSRYVHGAEQLIQTWLAALIGSLFCVAVLLTGRLLLPLGWSLAVAFATTLGTTVWTTASLAVWSQSWQVLMLAVLLLMLMRCETGRARPQPVILGILAGLLVLVRPSGLIHLAAIGAFMLFAYRPLFWRFALAGATVSSLIVIYSLAAFGTLAPGYYVTSASAATGSLQSAGQALAGLLLSPSRGLLIFSPFLILVCYLLPRHHRWLPVRRLVALATVICLTQIVAISRYTVWWGGFAYGPRLLTELMPWAALLTIAAVRARLDWQASGAPRRRWLAQAAWLAPAVVLVGLSCAVQYRGAFARETLVWNSDPISIDEDTSRLWDWRQPQALAGLSLPTRGVQAIDAGCAVAFGSGWHNVETQGPNWWRWSFDQAELRIEAPRDTVGSLAGSVMVINAPNAVRVAVNGHETEPLVLDQTTPREFRLDRLPLRPGLNTVTVRTDRPGLMPPGDNRLLAVSLGNLELWVEGNAPACAVQRG